MNELALFAGAGGGILGGHLLGWRCVCAVEYEPFPAAVLVQRQNDGILQPFPVWDGVRTFGEELLTSFRAGFHAKTSAPPAGQIERESTEKKAGCGEKCGESSTKCGQLSCSPKTPQCSFTADSVESLPTLMRFGLMRRGECFPLPTLEHDTSVKGYGSSERIGTPIKSRRCRSEKFIRGRTLNPYEHCKLNGGIPKIEWLEHLMAWPTGWTDLQPLETDKFQQWRQWHGNH